MRNKFQILKCLKRYKGFKYFTVEKRYYCLKFKGHAFHILYVGNNVATYLYLKLVLKNGKYLDNLQDYTTCNTDYAWAYTSYLLNRRSRKTKKEKICNVLQNVFVCLQEIVCEEVNHRSVCGCSYWDGVAADLDVTQTDECPEITSATC
jgi:hypothetical protein